MPALLSFLTFYIQIWDFNATAGSNYQPIYSLHTAFPVRRVLWRPSYECELAVVSNADFGTGSNSDLVAGSKVPSPRITERPMSGDFPGPLDDLRIQLHQKLRDELPPYPPMTQNDGLGDSVEIWDVRCQYIAKWVVKGSAVEGGVTGT
jgi:WD repeat-containing protein 24